MKLRFGGTQLLWSYGMETKTTIGSLEIDKHNSKVLDKQKRGKKIKVRNVFGGGFRNKFIWNFLLL